MCSKIAGHLKQQDFFKRVITSGRLSHSYILSGISGIGKRMFACELARSLFCKNGSYFTECTCSSCTQVKAGTYPDLYIYGGSELKVENIRQISESAGMTGLASKWKVFILDEAEKLSNSAQIVAGNAFLKTLEEPGDDCLFLLITSKYEMIMPTIRSRCSVVDFAPLSENDMHNVLSNIRPDMDNMAGIIKAAGGSVERALMIDDLKIGSLINDIESRNFKKFTDFVINCNDIQVIKAVMEFIYPAALAKYKATGIYSYCAYGEYILEILQRLTYNINIDLAKHDFVSKTIEVFSERI